MDNHWKLLVERCFRSGSNAFAPGFIEYQSAVRMFEEAKRVGASDEDILVLIKSFMHVKGTSEEQIRGESEYARTLLTLFNEKHCTSGNYGEPRLKRPLP